MTRRTLVAASVAWLSPSFAWAAVESAPPGPAAVPTLAPPLVPDADAAPPDPGAGPAAPAQPDLPEVRYRPQSMQFNSYVSFDEQGNAVGQNVNLTLSISFDWDGTRASVMKWQNLIIKRVLTSTGESLDPIDTPRGDGTVWRNFGPGNNQERSNFNLSLQLPLPARHAQQLTVVEGAVDLTMGVGPLREAILGPISEVEGKVVRINGIDNSRITVRRIADDKQPRVRLEVGQELLNLLADAQFLDAAGVSMQARGWGGGNNGGVYYREFRMDMPDTGSVRLLLFSELRTLTLPFILRDVPMPRTRAEDDAADLVIDAHPLGEARGGDGGLPPPLPGVERLDVLIA